MKHRPRAVFFFSVMLDDKQQSILEAYLAEILRDTPVKLTRLAFGLPVDSGVGYSDPLTLKRAFQNRVDA